MNASPSPAIAPADLHDQDPHGIFQNMLEGFALHEILLDDKGEATDFRFLAVNPSFERITGLAALDLIGKTVRQVLPGIEQERMDRYARIAQGGEPARFEEYSRELDRFFEVSAYRPGPGRFACTFVDVTERRRAEQSTRLNEARLESLLAISEHAGAGVQELLDCALAEAIRLTQSRIGNIYLYNAVSQEFVLNTWSREVMRKCTVAEKQTAYALEKTGIWAEAVRQRRAIILNDFQAPHPLKEGLPERHALLARYMTIPVFSGEAIVAVLGVANKPAPYDDADVRQLKLLMEPVWRIVERARAEEKGKEVQSRIESILEATETGLDIIDSRYRLLYVNEGWQERLGPCEGRSCFEYFQGRQTPCASCSMRRAVQTRTRVVAESYLEADHRHYQIISIPFQNADGEWLVSEINVDITERKQTEEALRSARELMSNLLERAPVSIYVTSREGRMRLVNRQWEKDAGISRVEALDAPLGQLFPAEAAERFNRDNLRVIATDEPLTMEECGGSPAAPRHFHTVKFPLHDAEGRVEAVGGMSLDITEMRQAAAERGKLELRAQRAQKLESLGVLAGGIAHDFNNLLMAILGNAELAGQEMAPGSPARSSIVEVEKAARKAAELTHQMLAYSGKGSFIVRQVDLGRIVDEMTHLLKVTIPKQVILEKRMAPDLPAIEADVSQMQQVAMNLLINASEAIGQDAKGTVMLETGVGSFTADYLDRSRVPQKLLAGSYVYLRVKDTGCGMNAETLEKMFEPFFSTKDAGRGLGLAAVHGIVRGHKGALIVESQEGVGSTFLLLFPPCGERPVERSRSAEPRRIAAAGPGGA